MSIYKKSFKKIKLSRLGGLSAVTLALLISSSASAVEIGAGDSWVVEGTASANIVGGNAGLLNDGSGSADDYDVYLDKPVVSMRVTSPTGKVEFFGVFNLDVLARRHLNMNESSKKGQAYDGREVRHIIENLTATVQAQENMYVTGGIGTVAFLQTQGNVVSRISAQDENFQLRERLFAEVAYVTDNGTTIQMSIFDGAKQKVLDSKDSFGLGDLYDPQKYKADSISGAIKVDYALSTDVHLTAGYAYVRNANYDGNNEQMVSVGVDAAYELGDWMVAGLVQLVHVFGDDSRTSVLGEIAGEKGKHTIYGQAEYTELNKGGDTTRGTLGYKYKLVDGESVKISPFAELFVESRSDQDEANVGFFTGVNMEFGKEISLGQKTE